VTKNKSMPWAEGLWLVSLAGGIDAQMPVLFGRPPIFQTTPTRAALAVSLVFLLSLVSYARFCTLVIQDITNYLGIACFTVRKRDADGVWRSSIAPPPPPANAGETAKVANGHTKMTNGHAKGVKSE